MFKLLPNKNQEKFMENVLYLMYKREFLLCH